MSDAITLDQLRVLVAIDDCGSFTAAAKRLRRVQSAASHAIAGLEAQLGLELFDRSVRIPRLTAHGTTILGQARRVIAAADALAETARALSGGLEPEVSLVVDALFPGDALIALCRDFAERFPNIALQIHSETLAAVTALVRDGTCHFGVVGSAAPVAGLRTRHLTTVRMITVVSREHPLAHRSAERIAASLLAEHVQIVISERSLSDAEEVPDQGVLSPAAWRVADVHTKHRMLLSGLGWGRLPEPLVRADLEKGDLVRIRPDAWPDEEILTLSVVQRPDAPLGPAASWTIGRMRELCAE